MKISEINPATQVEVLGYKDLAVDIMYEIVYEQSGHYIGKLCLLIDTDDGYKLLIPALITKRGHYCALVPTGWKFKVANKNAIIAIENL